MTSAPVTRQQKTAYYFPGYTENGHTYFTLDVARVIAREIGVLYMQADRRTLKTVVVSR